MFTRLMLFVIQLSSSQVFITLSQQSWWCKTFAIGPNNFCFANSRVVDRTSMFRHPAPSKTRQKAIWSCSSRFLAHGMMQQVARILTWLIKGGGVVGTLFKLESRSLFLVFVSLLFGVGNWKLFRKEKLRLLKLDQVAQEEGMHTQYLALRAILGNHVFLSWHSSMCSVAILTLGWVERVAF